MARPRIAIATGDPAGIGPEIALKAAQDPRVLSVCQPLLVGDRGALEVHARVCGLSPRLLAFDSIEAAVWDDRSVCLLDRQQLKAGELKLGQIDAAHGRAALDSAEAAVKAAMRGAVHAVVGAPHTEKAIALAGVPFDGYPSFVARTTGVSPDDAVLMLCWGTMRIAHVTLHVSLRRAIEQITKERVGRTIETVDDALRRIGIAKPRIAVSGLNPHAGEDGLFGSEEQEIIAPAVAIAKARHIDAEGPFGADTMFTRSGYDAFVVMVHDQGHIMAKTHAPAGSAALTIGTPVLFSSVGHGSALDIAGQNKAKPDAMIEAIRRLAGVA